MRCHTANGCGYAARVLILYLAPHPFAMWIKTMEIPDMNEIIEFNTDTKIDDNAFVVIIDGEKAQDTKSFFKEIYKELSFPYPQYANWDAYNDWMRDLSWIKEKHIIIIISSWEDFLKNGEKENFIDNLHEAIFPFWDKECFLLGDDIYVKELDVYYSFLSKRKLCETNNALKQRFIASTTKRHIEYDIKEVKFGNSKTIYVPIFKENSYALLEEFLLSEVKNFREQILENISAAEEHPMEIIEFCGNVCLIHIHNGIVRIESAIDNAEIGETVEMGFAEFAAVVKSWIEDCDELDESKFVISKARKYIKDNYQMDIIGCVETDDFWIFTAGDKNKKMYGNPRVIIEKGSYALRDASISMTEMLRIAREGKRLI